MNDILKWGLDIIIFVQQIRTPWLDSVFVFVSLLGTNILYFVIIPLLYWCVDKRMSVRLLIVFCFSNWINSEAKDLFSQPRPFHLNQSVMVGKTGSYGFPSGHAQGSFVLWGFLSYWAKKKWLYILSALLIFLISFSRIYLGVHFPTDILGGWIIGLVLLIIFFLSAEKIGTMLLKLNLSFKITISFAVPMLFAAISPIKHSVYPMAVLSGFMIGYCIENKYINFDQTCKISHKIFRYFSGIIQAGIILFILNILLPSDNRGSMTYFPFLYTKSLIMGLFISVGAPWIFKKLKI